MIRWIACSNITEKEFLCQGLCVYWEQASWTPNQVGLPLSLELDTESGGSSPFPPLDTESGGSSPFPPLNTESGGSSPFSPVENQMGLLHFLLLHMVGLLRFLL
ncbi:unnamed protein product [Rodentolepis nana]|uniref:Spondin domain-containing protein n=1 Tax=Rodentolepis nana TaxID=102285 RepID=A0A0R3TLU8_RODNA|nr:unnamed protein product [Rodentolepis nana]